MKNQKGITLTALVITVVIMLILASVAIYSGKDTINWSKFEKFATQLKMMQSNVNSLYDDDKEALIGDEIQEGTEIKEKADKVFTEEESGIVSQQGYRYLSVEKIAELGFEGIEFDFFVNLKKRSIVSCDGFEYDGKRYYTVEQLPNSLYNVEYKTNTNKPTFDVIVNKVSENRWEVKISNIQYDGYNSKWKVRYKKDGESNWNTTDEMKFIINDVGYYSIYIYNEDIMSEEKTITLGMPEPEPEASERGSLYPMLYGVIEVVFLENTSYTTTTIPNEPVLKNGMTPVYWASDENGNISKANPQSNTIEIASGSEKYNQANWYEYVTQTEDLDGKTSRWANATTIDGSYYVWIPRYAYRIVYFNTEEHEIQYRAGILSEEEALENGYITGYSDARGIVDVEGKRPRNETSTTAISVNDKYFRTHPVFDGNPDEGGWDSKLEGIWIMKYEASKPNASPTYDGSGTIPMSVPNVLSWRRVKIKDIFTYAKNAYNINGELNTILNSHMIKNSEWGAAAYLAESNYGRNGTEISTNQCTTYITGTGRGLNSTENSELTGTSTIYNSTYAYTEITDIQKNTGEVGQLSSTTGNIYGIYDMAGGAYEYTMGFLQDENGNIHIGNTASTNTGFNGFLKDGTEYTQGIEFPIYDKKYYQLYKKITTDGKDLGQALYETKYWNRDSRTFINLENPVFMRGGRYDNDVTSDACAGKYSFLTSYGDNRSYISFRVCLAVE